MRDEVLHDVDQAPLCLVCDCVRDKVLDGCREQVESLERSKASLSSKLAAAQEEAAHAKTELADQSSQAAKLKAQLSSITEAHSKVILTRTPLPQHTAYQATGSWLLNKQSITVRCYRTQDRTELMCCLPHPLLSCLEPIGSLG